jgi:hypothetical protein
MISLGCYSVLKKAPLSLKDRIGIAVISLSVCVFHLGYSMVLLYIGMEAAPQIIPGTRYELMDMPLGEQISWLIFGGMALASWFYVWLILPVLKEREKEKIK